MKQRVLTGIGISIVLIPIVILSKYIVYPIFLGLLSSVAVWELLRVFGFDKRLEIVIPSYLISALFPVFAHSIFTGGNSGDYLLICSGVLFAFLLYLAMVCVIGKELMIRRADAGVGKGQKILEFGDVATVFFSVTYVTVSFTSMSLTRYMPNGAYIFGIVFVAAWFSDTFAYFTGRLFGKHKLAPHLSPKKTVEGSLGGILFAMLACILYGFIIERTTGLNARYLVLAVLGLVLSAFSQLGDLFASLIKREHGVKDYSRIMPGHGGIMDRFDSIISISAILMAVSLVFPPFV